MGWLFPGFWTCIPMRQVNLRDLDKVVTDPDFEWKISCVCFPCACHDNIDRLRSRFERSCLYINIEISRGRQRGCFPHSKTQKIKNGESTPICLVLSCRRFLFIFAGAKFCFGFLFRNFFKFLNNTIHHYKG